MPKANSFTTPEGYFDNLASRIEEKTVAVKAVKKLSFKSAMVNQLAIAAGFILFVVISYSALHFILGDRSDFRESDLSYATLIENEIHEFETDMIIEAINETAIEKTEQNEELNNEEIIRYLIQENVSIDLIISEL